LNQLWKLNIKIPELALLGLQLGADVPIFIHGFAAWAEGIGEALSPIKLDEPYFVVLIPDVSVSTANIFASAQLKRNCTPITIEQFLSGEADNVCESIVRDLYPEVNQAIEWLDQFSPAMMTGTGACVFAPFPSQKEAQKILMRKPELLGGFIAKGLNLSPLYS